MFPEKLNELLQQRKLTNNFRKLPLFNTETIDFCSNDYLGLATKKFNTEKKNCSVGATGSRLISGNSIYIENLELYLAQFYQTESALLFNSGYAANQALLAALPQKGDTIIYDEYVHASIRDGIRLSFAEKQPFGHQNLNQLGDKLQNTTGDIYVVVESLYSMDGDWADVEKIHQLCVDYGAYLILDEAHSTAITEKTSKGVFESLGDTKNLLARVHTFGKALGSHGAVVVGERRLIDFLINFARPFIYTTALPYPNLEHIRQVHEFIEQNDDSARQKLWQNIHFMIQKIKEYQLAECITTNHSPIFSFRSGVEDLKKIEQLLIAQNFAVKTIQYPTVKKGMERIRFCLHSYNTFEQINLLLTIIKQSI